MSYTQDLFGDEPEADADRLIRQLPRDNAVRKDAERRVAELEAERDTLRERLVECRAELKVIARGPRWATGDTLSDFVERHMRRSAELYATLTPEPPDADPK